MNLTKTEFAIFWILASFSSPLTFSLTSYWLKTFFLQFLSCRNWHLPSVGLNVIQSALNANV